MLLYLGRWHIANERNPFGEARLLCFANGTPNPATPSGPANNNDNDPTDPPSPERDAEQPSQAVPTERSTTRNQVNATLEGGDTEASEDAEKNLSAESVYREAEAMKNKLESLRSSIAQILKNLPTNAEFNNVRQTWLTYRDELEVHIGPVRDSWVIAKNIHDWNNGKTPPADFVRWLKEHRSGVTKKAGGTPQTDSHITDAENIIRQSSGVNVTDPTGEKIPDVNGDRWHEYETTFGESERRHAIQKISDSANIELELLDVHNYISTLNKTIEASKVESEVEKTIEKLNSAKEAQERGTDGSMLPRINLELVSVMDVYNGVKGWWDAMQSAWDNKAQLRAGKVQSRVANMFRWLPFGDRAAVESEKKLDGTHRENKGKTREALDDGKPKFVNLFGPGNMFRSVVASNPDDMMAIIEYAADNGWLYTFKQDKLIDGIDIKQYLPNHWDENRRNIYIDNLIDQNQNGLEKTRSSTQEAVQKKYESKMDFLENEFDGYLRDINFGAAQGVMAAMYARAIDGDEAPWIAARFFNILRESPEVRRYLTPIIVQDFARVSAGKGFFAMSNLWADRGNLSKQARRADGSFDMDKAGHLAKTIADAEKLIIAAAAPDVLSKKDLEKNVAKFLAGKPVKLRNGVVSIWDPRFADYRSEEKNHSFKLMDGGGVKDTDNDYFASTDTNELLMASQKFLVEVFRTDSPQKWVNADKTTNFVGKLYKAYEELANEYANVPFARAEDHPLSILRAHLGPKIQQAMRENIDRSEQILPTKMSVQNESTDIGAVAALHAMGFVDFDQMGETGKKHKAKIQKDIDEIKAKLPRWIGNP